MIDNSAAGFNTIEKLLAASMAAAPIAISHEGKENQVKIWEFADKRFDKFLIRKVGLRTQLSETTHLTPVDYIYHGDNIGQPLMVDDHVSHTLPLPDGYTELPPGHNYDVHAEGISIILKQEGDPINKFLEEGQENYSEIIERIAKNPESLDRIFRTVALLSSFGKTFTVFDNDTRYPRTIDLNFGNILLTEDGQLGLIDQMAHEDIFTQPHAELDLDKAAYSLYLLRGSLRNINDQAIAAGSSIDMLSDLDAIYDVAIDVINEARNLPTIDKQLAFLQQNLSPQGEHWQGIEPVVTPKTTDEKLENPPFGWVTHVEATSLNIREALPNELLRNLNEMHSACVATSR